MEQQYVVYFQPCSPALVGRSNNPVYMITKNYVFDRSKTTRRTLQRCHKGKINRVGVRWQSDAYSFSECSECFSVAR